MKHKPAAVAVDANRSAACKVAWDTIRRNRALKAQGLPAVPKPAKIQKHAAIFKDVAPIPEATVEPIKQITDIADRAMLVRLSISMFNPVRADKKIGAEVAAKYNADVNMGRYEKNIIAKAALEKMRALESAIRQEHYRRTLPWLQDGSRILTSVGYFAYAEFMRKAQDEWNQALDDFVANYDTFVAEAKQRLNGLYNADDYPSKAQLHRKFDFSWKVSPVPVANDFRVALGADEVAVIRSQMEADLKESIEQSMKDIWTRLRDVVAKMSERLAAYNPEKPVEAPFRDTLVTNISTLLDIVPSLNLTGDSAIAAFCQEIRSKLTAYSGDTLRESDHARESVAKAAEDILSRMNEFFA